MRSALEGIEKVYFCAGARNHELLKVLEGRPHDFEYDERMASFKALGLTKAKNTPVAVCTTSGTAVAECVPAMLEAFYSKLPLVLISGDRPKKLHGTGSPQTIKHEELTKSCRGSYIEVTLEEFKDLKIENPVYPLHVNVLVDDTTAHSEQVVERSDISAFSAFLENKKTPLFLFSHEEKSMRPFIEKFSKTGIPFYAESLSGGRDLSTIKSERSLVRLFENNMLDCVVRVGFTPLSKIWRLLEKRPLPVFNIDARNLAGLSFGEVLPYSASSLLGSPRWWESLSVLSPYSFVEEGAEFSPLLEKYPFSEMALMRSLHNAFCEDDLIYLGNSLIVRFFELIQTKALSIHGNRGINGIDGQLSTAIGLAQGTTKEVYCVLGDITTLYDLSAIKEMPKNLRLIIINNRGGRIFDMLNLDKRMVMEHEYDFKGICQAFGVTYSNKLSELKDIQVLELFPQDAQTKAFLREWNS